MSDWTDNVEEHDRQHHDSDGQPRGLEDSDVTQCGTCLRKWCHVCTPTPASRCPFEYDHEETEEADDDLDAVVDAVREHSGDYLSMVEDLVEEVRNLRSLLGR